MSARLRHPAAAVPAAASEAGTRALRSACAPPPEAQAGPDSACYGFLAQFTSLWAWCLAPQSREIKRRRDLLPSFPGRALPALPGCPSSRALVSAFARDFTALLPPRGFLQRCYSSVRLSQPPRGVPITIMVLSSKPQAAVLLLALCAAGGSQLHMRGRCRGAALQAREGARPASLAGAGTAPWLFEEHSGRACAREMRRRRRRRSPPLTADPCRRSCPRTRCPAAAGREMLAKKPKVPKVTPYGANLYDAISKAGLVTLKDAIDVSAHAMARAPAKRSPGARGGGAAAHGSPARQPGMAAPSVPPLSCRPRA